MAGDTRQRSPNSNAGDNRRPPNRQPSMNIGGGSSRVRQRRIGHSLNPSQRQIIHPDRPTDQEPPVDDWANDLGMGSGGDGSAPAGAGPAFEGSPSDILNQEQNAARGLQRPLTPGGEAPKPGNSETNGGPGNRSAGPGSKPASGDGDQSSATGTDTASRKAKSGLNDQENDAGSFYKPGGGKRKGFNFKEIINLKGSAKRRIMLAIVSGVIGIFMAIMGVIFSILPLKTLSLMTYIQEKAFAALDNSLNNGVDAVLTSITKDYVFKTINGGGCKSTKIIDKCTKPLIDTRDPLHKLASAWMGKNGRQSLFQQLADKGYSLEVRNGHYLMTTPGGAEVNMDGVASGKTTRMTREVMGSQVGSEFMKAFEGQSFFRKAWARYRLGARLREYGVTRCLIACDFRDKFNYDVNVKKRAFQGYFIRRFVEPRSQLLGLVMSCYLNHCGDEYTSQGRADPNSVNNGEPLDEFDHQSRSLLQSLRAQYASDKIDTLVAKLDEVQTKGPGRYLFEQFIKKIGGGVLGKEITDEMISKIAGPIGWVVTAAKLIDQVDTGAKWMKRAYYGMQTASFVTMYYMFYTAAEEQKSGHTDAQMYGTLAQALNGGYDGTGLPAESSPEYKRFMTSGTQTPVAAAVRAIFPQKAYAADTDPAQPLCNDNQSAIAHQGKEVKLSNGLCPEEQVVLTNFLTIIHDALFKGVFAPLVKVVVALAKVIQAIAGPIQELASKAMDAALQQLLPKAFYEQMKAIQSEVGKAVITWISETIFPSPIPKDRAPDGARLINMAIPGAETAANDSAHTVIGGQLLSTKDKVAIAEERDADQRADFAAMPLWDRVFSTDTSRSFVSQFALAAPGTLDQAVQGSFGSMLANPLGTFAGNILSFVTPHKAKVEAQAIDDPFGIDQYGIPSDNEVFKSDVFDYYDKYCKDGKINEAYNTPVEAITDPALKKYGFTISDTTGVPVNKTPNPCYLLDNIAFYNQNPTDTCTAGGGAAGGGAAGSTAGGAAGGAAGGTGVGGGNGLYPATITNAHGARWKVTLPALSQSVPGVSSNGGAPEIKEPAYLTFSDPKYFHLNQTNDGVVFDVSPGGATTGGSSNPRSELRETYQGNPEGYWNAGQGTHVMEVQGMVTAFTAGTSPVVIAQVHDANDDVSVWRVEGNQLWITNGNTPHGFLVDGNFQLNKPYTIKYEIVNGTYNYYYNGVLVNFHIQNSNPSYFKTGNYLQSSKHPGDSGTAEVLLKSVIITHDGKAEDGSAQTTGGTTGGAAAGGGAGCSQGQNGGSTAGPSGPAGIGAPKANCADSKVICITADGQAIPKLVDGNILECDGHKVGRIEIHANNVTVQNCVISGVQRDGIQSHGTNNTLQNNDISGVGNGGAGDINAITFFGDGTKILSNKFHDVVSGDPGGSHTDCIQTWANADDINSSSPSSNVTISGNWCEGPVQSDPGYIHQCIMAEGPGSKDDGGNYSGPKKSENWTVTGNYCKTYGNQAMKFDAINNVTISKNTFAGAASTIVYKGSLSQNVTFAPDNIITGQYGSQLSYVAPTTPAGGSKKVAAAGGMAKAKGKGKAGNV